MTTRPNELEDFKTEINLSEYAAAQGYAVDPKASGKSSVSMKHPGGDKIIIGMSKDGHWIYWSVHDESDNGTIIDFVQNRKQMNIGQVRMELRPWLGGSRPPTALPSQPDASSFAARVEYVPTDLAAVRSVYEAAEPVSGHHPYLCTERAIPASLLASDRFAGRVRTDDRGNALFPHWNAEGLVCGFEIKNKGFTGFAKHGMKGLWGSKPGDTDLRLVIAETAIDALSYAVLFGYCNVRFVSTAGQMSSHQPGLLNSAIRKMPEGGRVIVATDNDEGGQKLAEYIRPIFDNVVEFAGRSDLEFVVHSPTTAGDDWNDELRARPPQPAGGGRPGPG